MHRLHLLDTLTIVATKPVGAPQADWEAATAAALDAVDGGVFRIDPPAPVGRPGAGHSHVIVSVDEPPRAVGFETAQADIRTDRWVRHGATLTPEPDADVTALIAAEVLSTDAARLAEWDEWYDRVHLPDMMSCGAFVGGTRWRRADPRPGTADNLTVYEIAGTAVGEAIEMSAAIMPGLIAAGRKHECHAGGLTMALSRV
ncbi:MAG: hypothetical protein DHS20C19_07020 [Acidimicrobiales bacterium]|nr:MAG: hypothetical protein DHS20C19_07020 [Acidimicrobiales bacterium]